MDLKWTTMKLTDERLMTETQVSSFHDVWNFHKAILGICKMFEKIKGQIVNISA
jgi:hypothetical protein